MSLISHFAAAEAAVPRQGADRAAKTIGRGSRWLPLPIFGTGPRKRAVKGRSFALQVFMDLRLSGAHHCPGREGPQRAA